ncbi:hypothetical protein N836_13655 [Leptolyngbya sp. Heron Island J]|uniref:hypothetical protein n=1 Tax=Leptolyngbya sp. Heron Island J TaxID=1385935 RepID=UPI0003B9A051|nr:hypothetical protein [Leptolyngbya sp. Heron Island J]ESA35105.1 hypothetical protein N836_13655 [Leptolyngbya sp. Heron Island J]
MNRKVFLQLIAMSSLAWLIPPKIRAKAIAESWPCSFDVENWKAPTAIYPLQSKTALKFHEQKVDYLKMLGRFGRGINESQQTLLDFLQYQIDFWEFDHIRYGHLNKVSKP